MKRRRSELTPIRAVVLSVCVALASCGATDLRSTQDLAAGGRSSVAATRPNIILIMADDVGIEAFSSYGDAQYETPEITRLARDGMRFTQCHSQPLCTPSRVKLMTGLSNSRNYEAFSILPRGSRSFAQHLGALGYASCVVGKWQLLGAEHYKPMIRGKGTTPKDAGFEEWCLWQVEKLGSRYWQPMIDTNGRLETFDGEVFGPDLYTSYLLDFIERNKDRPFLAYYPMALVHDPFVRTPLSASSKRGAGKRDKAHFGEMLRYMDSIVGKIRRHVDALGIAEKTLLVFTSDNGTHRKISSRFRGRVVQGGKGSTTARGTHVPMIAYWPSVVRASSVCGDLVDFSDFLPTMVEVAGGEAPTKLDGISFAPKLRGQRGPSRRAIPCYYHPRPKTRKRSRAVHFAFDKTHKLYADGRLFDLVQDPEEESPLAQGAAPEKRRALERVLQETARRG